MDHKDKPSDGELLHDDALDATLARTNANDPSAGDGPSDGVAVGTGADGGGADTADERSAEGDPITTERR